MREVCACVCVCVFVCVCVCVHVAAPLCVPVFTPCVLQEVDKMKRGFEEQMTKMRGEVSKIQEEKVWGLRRGERRVLLTAGRCT